MKESGGQFGATSESGLLGIPFNQQPAAPSGQLKLPGIPEQPLGYNKMLDDLMKVKTYRNMDRYANNRGAVGNDLKNYYGTFNTPMLGQGGNY